MGGYFGVDFVICFGCGMNVFIFRSVFKGRIVLVIFYFYWIGFRCDGVICGI